MEDKSTSTRENALFSLKFAEDHEWAPFSVHTHAFMGDVRKELHDEGGVPCWAGLVGHEQVCCRWKDVVVATNPFHQLRSRLVFQCACRELFPPEQQPKARH